LFVCFFVAIKPEKPYFASCVGREVNPLGVITHGKKHKAGNLHVRGSYKLRGTKGKTGVTADRDKIEFRLFNSPRGFTSLPTQEAKHVFSGFIATKKQTNK